MSRAGRAVAATAALGLAAVLSSCTYDGDASSTPSASMTSPDTPASTSAGPTPTPSSSATSSSATSSAASSTPAPSSSAAQPPAFTTTCASLSVRVLKGGAIRGAEIAAIQFVNDGSSTCTITGTPTASLLRNGTAVGAPSQPQSSTTPKPFTLAPGDTGESLLRDFSGCNAPLSDNLRVAGPSRNGKAGRTFTEPVTLRACTLRVAAVAAPA